MINKGKKILTGFNLQSKSPLDVRVAVSTLTDRDKIITYENSYPGMIVYVVENDNYYKVKHNNSSISFELLNISAVDNLSNNYMSLEDAPIMLADLSLLNPTNNTYYQHIGENSDDFTKNVIYYNKDDVWYPLIGSSDRSEEVIQSVEHSLPSELSTSGTLTDNQMSILKSNDSNYIKIKYTDFVDGHTAYEIYRLHDKDVVNGTYVYTHDGFNEVGCVKYLTLTTSTGSFVLKTIKHNEPKYLKTLTLTYYVDGSQPRGTFSFSLISDDSNYINSTEELIEYLHSDSIPASGIFFNGTEIVPVIGIHRNQSYFILTTGYNGLNTYNYTKTQLKILNQRVELL